MDCSSQCASRSMCVVACMGSPTTSRATELVRANSRISAGFSTCGRMARCHGPMSDSSRLSWSLGSVAV